jgi:hypothetical protein
MKIKLCYPKIPSSLNCPLRNCWAFEKYDGTLIHVIYNPQLGWFDSFGTRRDSFSFDEDGFKQFHNAHPELFNLVGIDELWDQDGKLAEYLSNEPRFSSRQEIMFFAEYFGPNSFAGSHDPKDKMQLVILDVQVDGALLPPDQFITLFQDFPIAKVVFKGRFTGQLFSDVRNGKYDVKEGVVVKGVVDGKVYMCKIKTNEYLQKLKETFKDKWKEYGE